MKSILSDREAVKSALKDSESLLHVLTRLGLRAAGGNYAALKRWCVTHGLELPSYDYSVARAKRKTYDRISNDSIFIEESTYTNRTGIKTRLRKLIKSYECSDCGLGEMWNGKPITLQLEHKNGIWNDNRLENLTLLCPNCHSQTSSFAGRNSKK